MQPRWLTSLVYSCRDMVSRRHSDSLSSSRSKERKDVKVEDKRKDRTIKKFRDKRKEE